MTASDRDTYLLIPLLAPTLSFLVPALTPRIV